MARLYSNENFPLPVVQRLRALGHDVLTIQEAGKADQAQASNLVVRHDSMVNATLTQLRREAVAPFLDAG